MNSPPVMPGMIWPEIPASQAWTAHALLDEFRNTERLPRDLLIAGQHRQIHKLASHAHTQSYFWRKRLDAAGYGKNADWFEQLPILTKAEVKAAGKSFLPQRVPGPHGQIHVLKTSGSTGTPLRIPKTDLALQFWKAMTVRDSQWHGRNLLGKLAAIRVGAAMGRHRSWGSAYEGLPTGPGVTLDARTDIDTQIDWLCGEQPDILLTHASNLAALATRCRERGIRLATLREVRTYSESLPAQLRELAREVWGVPLTDVYSANEVGCIALQCPDSGLYHIVSEDVLVELIGDDGHGCSTGQSGRVVVTSLHNFAMPLMRYDIGDYATAGGTCACGRTLPTLQSIQGRSRNMMRLPGGRTAWPGFPMNTLVKLTAIREFKMIQHSLEEIEILLVLIRPLLAEEQSVLTEAVRTRLGHPFTIRLTPVTVIERGTSHKREDFECRVT